MTTTWVFENSTTSTTFTSNVVAAQMQQGRTKFLDNYSGGVLSCTIRNNTNQASGFSLGDAIKVSVTNVAGVYQLFSVIDIQFDNEYGNMAAATATITAVDRLGLAGRYQKTSSGYLGPTTTGVAMDAVASMFLNESYNTYSIVPNQTSFFNQVLARSNVLATTEIAVMMAYQNKIRFYGRGKGSNSYFFPSVAFGRTANATTIGYNSFSREKYGSKYANQITIQPSGLTAQTAENLVTPVVTETYSTLDENTTQALNLSNYIRQVKSNLSTQAMTIGFTDADLTVSTSGLGFNWYSQFAYNFLGFYNVSYRVPGAGSDTTELMFCEGYSARIVPGLTDFTLYLSPGDFHQFFTLNSSTLGVLDTSRLGW